MNEVKLLGLVGGEVKEDKTTVFWIVTNDVDRYNKAYDPIRYPYDR